MKFPTQLRTENLPNLNIKISTRSQCIAEKMRTSTEKSEPQKISTQTHSKKSGSQNIACVEDS